MTFDYFQAVRRNGAAAIESLSALDDINLKNQGGENLLHEAIAYGNGEVAHWLIDRGIDVNSQNADGQSPLHYAGSYQNLTITSRILSSGGKLEIVDKHGNTPLWSAVFSSKGDYKVVDAMLQSGGTSVANWNNKAGRSPLDFARQIGDQTLMEKLSHS